MHCRRSVGISLPQPIRVRNNCCDKAFRLRRKWRAEPADLMKSVAALERCEGATMISKWSDWKRYPRPAKGENIEAPISPGIYEVRFAGTGALHSFGAVDNVAQALSQLAVGAKS